MKQNIDPKLDLVLERNVDVPPHLVWRAWTTPEHIKKWFTPAPWKTVECELDLRPGGRFYTVMQSPEGEKFPNEGCYLEIVENQRLTWTNALAPGFRPNPDPSACPGDPFYFTAIVEIEPDGNGGTKYTAIAMHSEEKSAKRHADMGFQDGWGAALTQLVELAKSMA